MTSDGTVIASIPAGSNSPSTSGAQDAAGNGNQASTSTDHTVTWKGSKPSLTINQAAGQNDPSNASPINFTVVFSESVNDFATGDVTLGGTAGATTATVTGSGTTYNVAVTGMANDGTVIASIQADKAHDSVGNGNTASTSTDNTVTYDTHGPDVTVTPPPSPQTASTVHFTATVSETTVDTIGNGDITVGGTAGATSGTVTGTGPTYDIAVSGMTMTGTITVKVNANAVSDAAGNPNAASNTASVQWNQTVSTNNAPVVTITSPTPYSLYAKPANVSLSASFTDPDAGQTHTCSISWDDGSTTTPAVSPDSTPTTPGTCAQSHTYNTAGVYTIVVTVCDNFSPQGCDSDEVMIVVYDASAGFITGGGWINVDPGSYPANPTLTGRANFGFNSQYKKGSTVPTGETEFQFQVGNLNFHSTAYSWLVVSGYKAQYKGTGTVNGVSGYDFTLTAYDGAIAGAGQSGYDRFRIKITKNGATVFDNRNGASMDMDAANPQNIGGGSIVIHKA
jgi:hypothetical protein